MLNVREATHKQIMENKEINDLVKIMGLTYKKKYESVDDLKSLRYGKIMIMTDQDQDGSHIKVIILAPSMERSSISFHTYPIFGRQGVWNYFVLSESLYRYHFRAPHALTCLKD